ncbi:MAG: DUF86 domain-containing protein [Syntrophobacteraceae bacterium]
MSPSKLRAKVVAERIAWIQSMMKRVRELPLQNWEAFTSDPRNIAAAESYVRRALEALLDLGRHVLAKGFGRAATEYREIAVGLLENGVLSAEEAGLMRELAGYRNRMVHFYQEITNRELFDICTHHLADMEALTEAIVGWIKNHPDRVDQTL